MSSINRRRLQWSQQDNLYHLAGREVKNGNRLQIWQHWRWLEGVISGCDEQGMPRLDCVDGSRIALDGSSELCWAPGGAR